jgi:hypothetical protein
MMEASGPADVGRLEAEADQILDYVAGTAEGFPPQIAARIAPAEAETESAAVLAGKLRTRQPIILELKKRGFLGENNRGYVELRSSEGLTDETKNLVQRMLSAENADRKTLYRELARLENNINVGLTLIERVYSMERLMGARPGELFQLPPEGGDLARLRESRIGKGLGDAFQAEAWVVTP